MYNAVDQLELWFYGCWKVLSDYPEFLAKLKSLEWQITFIACTGAIGYHE